MRVSPREVIIDRNDVDGDACHGSGGSGQGGGESFSFTCRHFGNTAIQEDPSSEDLHVIVALPDRPICDLADKRKRTTHQLLGKPVATEPFPQLNGLLTQLFVRQTGESPTSFRDPLNHLGRKTSPNA